jgi:Transglutaminase-like superfamily
MCLHHPVIANLSQWNWDGDRIVFDSIVPSSRLPIGRKGGGQYDIDVREFLVTENNAIMKRTLNEDLVVFMKKKTIDPEKFTLRSHGAFDFRAHIIAAFVSEAIHYKSKKGRDPWQFPDETLYLKCGDCEDIAFLLGSLLLASGISPYNVRVVLGKVHAKEGKKRTTFDHMWVMYKSESGTWLLLEPLHLNSEIPVTESKLVAQDIVVKNSQRKLEYSPRFMFNADHLWIVGDEEGEASFNGMVTRGWRKLNPKFVGEVHQTILNQALQDIAPKYVLDALNRHFSRILWSPVIDDADNFVTHGYDPRDHFDNGFIAEGWGRVNQRLASFKNNNDDLDNFAYAAHGIADFYSHTSYMHFAKIENGKARLYDPNTIDLFAENPSYQAGSSFDLVKGAFSMNKKVFNGTGNDAASYWNGKLISGRYAQTGDSQTKLEALTFIPRHLIDGNFKYRGGLPHHNEIAVDDSMFEKGHKLYRNIDPPPLKDRTAFINQFNWRKEAAVAHIRQVFQGNWKSN